MPGSSMYKDKLAGRWVKGSTAPLEAQVYQWDDTENVWEPRHVVEGWVNVKSYGAKGDGTTNEDTALSDAINALPSGGGTLYFPDGTYLITAALTRVIANVTIQGNGEATVLRYSADTGNAITIGGNNWTVRDLRITGNATATAGALVSGSGYSQVRVLNCHFVNGWTAVAGDTANSWYVTGCQFETQQNDGVSIGGSLTDNFVGFCRFSGCGADAVLLAGTSARTTVLGCVATACSNVVGVGAGNAFRISNSNDNRIEGCLAYSNHQQGFTILGASERNIITGCVAQGNGGRGDAHEGITLYESTVRYNVVVGNVCSNNYGNQIEVFDAGGYNLIEGNYCEGGANAGTLTSGIFLGNDVATASPRTIVKGNVCRGNKANGIHIHQSPLVIVEGNICIDNDQGNNTLNNTYQHGISLSGASTNCIVSGNICTNVAGTTQEYGIWLANTATALITGNYFDGNNAGAILDSVGSSTIRNNLGYVTENAGAATITNGNTSVTVTHGLAATPAAQDLHVTATNNPTNDPGHIWVDTITATQFNINCRTDPGASGLSLAWQAIIL